MAFLTLIERKVLRYIQSRKGPNKTRFQGFLQPIRDAVKLFLKEFFLPGWGNLYIFIARPVVSLFLVLLLWGLIFFFENPFVFKYVVFLFLGFMRLEVYPLFISGWSSNNKYSIFGAVRGIVQTLSFEINFSLVLFSVLLLGIRARFLGILKMNYYLSYRIFFLPLLAIFLILLVVDSNRTPFDFAEGESELVSGFNTEYSSGLFALIFLSEYAKILLFSMLVFRILFFSRASLGGAYLGITTISGLWIWVRATFPRFRYDLLLSFCWEGLLPFVVLFFLYVLGILVFFWLI